MRKKETLRNYAFEAHLYNKRMWVAIVLAIILTIILIARLFYLQIIQKDLYTTLSRENQFNLIPIEPNRGLIYDRNGVLLAENIPIYNLEIIPERAGNLKQTIAALRNIVEISDEDILQFQKDLRQHRPYESVPLKIRLTDEEVARLYVNLYKFPGVAINARLMRYYPLGASMNSVVGYVGRINEQDLLNIDSANYAGSNYIGKLGIEKYFEPQLHGTVGYQQVEINANGRVVRTLKRIPTIPGDNLYLTIDSNLQIAAEKAMGDISGAVVAIQPKTGQVLALVSNPNYDPNQFVNGISVNDFKILQNEPGKPLFNRAIRGQFPIGSTIKPFMAVAGLDYGIITPSFAISDPGYYTIPGGAHVYHDWWPGGHGRVNVVKAITVSCDTFMYTIGFKMGINNLTKNLTRFGFGKKTGIEMDEELPGLVPSPAWKQKMYGAPWFGGDTVVLSIGQGYMTGTPLQLAQAVAIIANRGVRYKPTLLLKSQKPDGTFVDQKPISETAVTLSDPKIWDLILTGMKDVAHDPKGTAYQWWKDTPYSAAAKTGTAQVFRYQGKLNQAKVAPNLRNHSLFIVFAPADNPKIALAVVAEHSLVPAKEIARKIVDYYLLEDLHMNFNKGDASANPNVITEKKKSADQ